MTSAMNDEAYMAIAIDLAWSRHGKTAENPSVGCILVKDGHIVGHGVTGSGGRPHGETGALLQAGDKAYGATAYVTLEPCSHYGQTPPCAKALIKAGITRCVIACIDPDPRVHWRGAAMLQEAGIDTVVGVGADEAFQVHADFFAKFA